MPIYDGIALKMINVHVAEKSKAKFRQYIKVFKRDLRMDLARVKLYGFKGIER